MTAVKKHFDLALLGLVIGGFLLVASQRLATVPVPDTDESYMLQTSYEMIYRGNLALPFRQLLGGNIETTWHSFTPLHYVIQSGFLKIFGWGLLQGRIFNLIMSSLMLVLLYVIARKLFDWRTGLIAVLSVVSDVTFLGRSRYLRNDYSAAMFALLAFYLYETAEQRKGWRWFVACGLAAGAAVMTHTTGLYMVLAILVLMMLRRGWRVLMTGALYQFGLGAFVVSAYEIIYDVIDYKNVLLQNRGDNRHFKVLDALGWWKDLKHEPRRYNRWYVGGSMFPDVPRTLLHLFQLLAAVGICYLIVWLFVRLRRGDAIAEPRVRVLIATVVAALFFAVVASQKAIYYMAHLAPWFALCAAIFVGDTLKAIGRLRDGPGGRFRLKAPKFAYAAAMVLAIAGALAVGWLGIKQTGVHLRAVRNPDSASFDDLKTALRSIVPEGVCPVAVREPVLWLAFPEHDLCFLNIQRRMRKTTDIDGKEFAMIVSRRDSQSWVEAIASKNHHLIGALTDTPYGSYEVYYTGADPRWLALEPMQYQFFRQRRGYVSATDIAEAREAWSADAASLKQCGARGRMEEDGLVISPSEQSVRADRLIELCTIELKRDTIHQIGIDAMMDPGRWFLVIVEEKTGAWVLESKVDDLVEIGMFRGLFKTGSNTQFKIYVRPIEPAVESSLKLKKISIREVAPVYRDR